MPSPSETHSPGTGSQEPSPRAPVSADPPAYLGEAQLGILSSSIGKDSHETSSVPYDNNFNFSFQPPFLEIPSLGGSNTYASAPRWTKYGSISEQIYAFFPPPETLNILVNESFGTSVVLAPLSVKKNKADNRPEATSVLTCLPPLTSHPALLAKRLVQLAFCLQHLPVTIGVETLGLNLPTESDSKSAFEIAEAWVSAAAAIVTGNDALIGCVEGIECLLFQSLFWIDAGHFRKAWMAGRRAMSTAQLMGLDRRSQSFSKCPTLPSCDPDKGPAEQPRPEALWWRLNCNDRYLSLMLGLPIGSRDNSFAADEYTAQDAPEIRLGKAYTVITSKVADRNDAIALGNSAEAYALTQAIDLDLERAARVMKNPWWRPPNMTARGGHAAPCAAFEFYEHQGPNSAPAPSAADETVTAAMTLKIQVRHYSLLILTHLPYLLREREGRRYEYNRATCMQASRAILERFLSFRTIFTRSVSGRSIDYAGLIAAATLMLGHLPRRRQQQQNEGEEEDPAEENDEREVSEREQDRELAEAFRDKMCELAAWNKDRLAAESAEAIAQLLPFAMRHADNINSTSLPMMEKVQHDSGPGTGYTAQNSSEASSNTQDDPLHSLLQSCGAPGIFHDMRGDCPIVNTMQQQTRKNPCLSAEWHGDIDDRGLQGIDTVFWSIVRNGLG
jgi:hypothetical protein